MEKMILDLRFNPGGLLDQAVRVSDRFLKQSAMIVYTKGRLQKESDREYHAVGRTEKFDLPLIVLVNKGSASASEIVAGAVQDHDRGLVVGETTWGKGLVQTVYPLQAQAGLALTTAKYYTPSGRLIQRDYHSLEDYVSGANTIPEEAREAHATDSGRRVLGGGGISPDVEISLPEASKFVDLLERRTAFFDYALTHTTNHPEKPPLQTFHIGADVIADFKRFLTRRKIAFTDQEVADNLEYIKVSLHAEIIAYHYGLEERQRILSERDAQIQKALELIPMAGKLPIMAGQTAGAAGGPSPPQQN